MMFTRLFSILTTGLAASLLLAPVVECQTIRIVQLGDSYAAGNGGKNYEDTTCFRSPNNWGSKMTEELNKIMVEDFVYTNNACSGKEVSDLASQNSVVNVDTNLVIIGVGGNDLNFEDIVTQCYVPFFRDFDTCTARLNGASNAMGAYQSSLTSALLDIRNINSNVVIIVVAYPHITLDTSYELSDNNITPLARRVGNEMDDAQQAAVDDANAAAGTDFVFFYDDTKALFDDHEPHPSAVLANTQGWVWELSTEFNEEIYHLNPTGHSELGKALAPFARDVLGIQTPPPTASPTVSTPSPTPFVDDALVYCSQSKDRIQLDAGEEKQYACPGGASGPAHLYWRTSPTGSEGFSDDEFIIKVYQDGNLAYESGEFFDSVGTTQLSGVFGTDTRGSSSFVVEFDCTLSFFDCDDGFFEFKLVECGCPNGQPPLQACDTSSFEDTKDAVCSNAGPAPLPTSAPAPSPGGGGGFCFSGLSEVETEDKGSVHMSNLQVGDMVLTSEGYQPIYAFAHHHATKWATFLQFSYETIATNSTASGNPQAKVLELSPEHMVFVHDESTRNPMLVRASSVKLGDKLLYHGWSESMSTATPVTISEVKKIQRPGVYAPLTASSTIVVNGVLASNYVGVQFANSDSGEAVVKLSNGWVTPFHEADLIHLFLSPLRLVCSPSLSSKACQLHANKANPGGMHPYVAFGFRFVEWWEQQATWLQVVCMFLGIGGLGGVYLLELVLVSSSVALLVSIGLTVAWISRSSKLRQK